MYKLKTRKQAASHHSICLLYATKDGLTYNIIVVTHTEMKVNYFRREVHAILVSLSANMETIM